MLKRPKNTVREDYGTDEILQLLEIQKTNDNNKCVDCNAPSPQWVRCPKLSEKRYVARDQSCSNSY